MLERSGTSVRHACRHPDPAARYAGRVQTQFDFEVAVTWTGSRGVGTVGHRDYDRDHIIAVDGLPDIAASADRAFRGDASRHNPEQLLLAALSGCHMMSLLFQAAAAGVVVVDYEDSASAVLKLEGTAGRIVSATLRPLVTIASADLDLAQGLHEAAHRDCFIANSVSFPVTIEPTTVRA